MSASLLDDKPHLPRRILPEAIGVLAFVLVTYWFWHGLPLNHDTSWYLISTGWWLDGARIGEDIAELNPPLAYYLTAPAVLFARLVGWDTTKAMVVYVLIIWFVSVVWFSAIGARSHDVAPYRRRALVAVACLAFFVLSLSDFAQRDFLMVIFALPYLALVSFHPDKKDLPTSERVAIGIYATLGLALKPHFLILPAAMTIAEIVRRRSLAPIFEAQNLAIATGCVVYLSAAYILHPAYFTDIVPMAWITYAAYGYSPLIVAVVALPTFIACLFALYGLSKLEGETFVIGIRLLVATLACLLAYFVQFKGWSYQLLPAAFLAFLACPWVVMGLATDRRDVVRACAVALATVILLVVAPVVRGVPKNAYPEAFLPFFQNDPGERSFLAMTTIIFVSFPLANIADAKPVSRFPALWIIPGAVARLALDHDLNAQQTAQLNAYLEYARQATVEDFVEGVPELVIVDAKDQKPYFQGVAFDYLAFFGMDPRFQELWQRYHYVGTALGFDVYRLDE